VRTYEIALIPGDGIGVDVISEGLSVLQHAAEVTDSFRLGTTRRSPATDRGRPPASSGRASYTRRKTRDAP